MKKTTILLALTALLASCGGGKKQKDKPVADNNTFAYNISVGIANADGTKLIVKNDEQSEVFNKSFTKGYYYDMVFDIRFANVQQANESEDNTGRDDATQFHNMGGYVYDIVPPIPQDEDAEETGNNNWVYIMVADKAFPNDFNIEKTEGFNDYGQDITKRLEDAKAKLEKEYNRKIIHDYAHSRTLDGKTLFFSFQFENRPTDALGICVLDTGTDFYILEEPATFEENDEEPVSVWRVDDSGFYSAPMLKTLFTKKSDGTPYLFLEDSGAEGFNYKFVKAIDGKLIPVVEELPYFYSAPI